MPASDDASHLHAGLLDLEHLAGDALEHLRIDAELGAAEQRLAGELDQNAFVAVCHRCDVPCLGRGDAHFAIKKTPLRAGFSVGR